MVYQISADFRRSMMACAPVLLDFYQAGGVRITRWMNTEYYDNYKVDYPDVLMKRAEAQIQEFPARFVLVSESENMCRKAALLLAWKKMQVKYDYAIENNYPIDGRCEDLIQIPEMLQVDLNTQEKATFEQYMNTCTGKMTGWDSVYYTGLSENNLNEEFIRYMMYENKFNSFVGISPQLFAEPQIQRLLYEQMYEVIFLPKETDEYYERLGDFLLFMPAAEACTKFCNEKGPDTMEELLQAGIDVEIPYISMLGRENVPGAIRRLRAMRGRSFKESDIAMLFETALEKECNLLEVLQAKRQRTMDDLKMMNGFGQIEALAKKQMALGYAKRRNAKLKNTSGHYLFFGKPGTGKTEGARLLYEVLGSAGCISGAFVVATRKDIIGSYVGQTAPKVAELFDKAADGILFIDEAGFFLQRETGGFVKEAIKEFVRFMETRRDVCVIFAVYPEEKEKFLDLDKGLTSRITQIVPFVDYTQEQLLDIGDFMWKEQGYQVRKEGRELLAEYLTKKRLRSENNFGNAREVRRLVELSIQETELRLMETGKTPARKGLVTVTNADIKKAMEVCLEGTADKKDSVGFRIEKKEEKKDGKRLPERFPLLYEMA